MLTINKNNLSHQFGTSRIFLPSLFVVEIVLLILRRPDAVFMAQPFAEDGKIFLQQAIQYSWTSIFLNYAGYLHLIPRIIANFSLDVFGLPNAPIFMNVSAAIISVLCSMFISTKQFRFLIKNDLLRCFCSLFIILIPGVSEVYLTITNIQWFLTIFVMFFTILLLFNYEEFRNKPRFTKYMLGFFCALIFLSAPFTFIFLPVLIYVIIRELKKNRYIKTDLLSIVLPISILLVHIVLFLRWAKGKEVVHHTYTLREYPVAFINSLTTSTAKIFYFDTQNFAFLYGKLIYIIPSGIFLLIILNSIRQRTKIDLYILLYLSIMTISTLVFRPDILLQYQGFLAGSERYLVPTMTLIFFLIIRASQLNKSFVYRAIFVFIGGIIVLNLLIGFSLPPFPDMDYKEIAEMYSPQGAQTCVIAIVPGWEFSAPCSDPLPDWAKFKQQDSQGAKMTIDSINEISYEKQIDKIIINKNATNSFTIKGWAVDLINKDGKVRTYLDFSNNIKKIEVRTTKTLRSDVAKHFNITSYQISGWETNVDTDQFEKSCYSITIKILSKTHNLYYELSGNKPICFN